MTASVADRSPAAPPHVDPLSVLRAAHGRALEREGIPMFVTIDDIRDGTRLVVTDESSLTEGHRLAELFDHYHGELAAAGFPNFDPEDEPDLTGARELIDTFIVLAEQHLQADQDVR